MTVTITLTDEQNRTAADTIQITKDTEAPQLLVTSAPPSSTVYRAADFVGIWGTAYDLGEIVGSHT